MASHPRGDKPKARSLLTGTAQPVTNSVARATEHFKGHPERNAPPAKERKNFRTRRPEAEPEADTPDGDSEE